MSIGINEQIMDDFAKHRQLYEELDGIVADKLQKIIKDNGFFVMDLVHRVKTKESLRGKLKKKKGKYKKLTDITDICAMRIICYFENTVDEIAKELSKNFVVDLQESIDKRAVLQATQFGYLSLHYIISLRPEDGYSPELCAIRVEVQIRTVLQHAWAEIEHDLGYKSKFGIPTPIRREFSRVAGLLEIADSQFSRLKHSIKSYEADIRAKIDSNECLDMPVNEVTLNEFTAHNHKFIKYVEDECKRLGVDYFAIPVYKYLEIIDWLGIRTLGDLVDCLEKNYDNLTFLLKGVIERYGFDFITTGTLFKLLFFSEIMERNYDLEQVTHFMRLQWHDDEIAKERAKSFLSGMKKLDIFKVDL